MLEILEFPDPRLRTKAQPVTVFDQALLDLIDGMFETMYAAPGIGLAATQVNVHKQLLVLDVSEEKNQPLVLINPAITAQEGAQVYQEGCLSVPGIFADVERADRITRRSARSPRQTAQIRSRRPARGVHPARDGSSDRQTVRRLPLAAQARAGTQEARQAAPRRVGRLNSTDPLRVAFAGTPDFAVPHLRACAMRWRRDRRGLYPAGSPRRTRTAAGAEPGQAGGAAMPAIASNNPNR